MIEFLVLIVCVAALCLYVFVEFLGPFLYLERCQKERKQTRERSRNSQKAPLLGEAGSFNGISGTLMAKGNDKFQAFVPWLEKLVHEACLLGYEPDSFEMDVFLKKIGLVCDEIPWTNEETGLNGTFLLAWGDSENQAHYEEEARKDFAWQAEVMYPGAVTKIDGVEKELIYLKAPNGRAQWSAWLMPLSSHNRRKLLKTYEVNIIETSKGPCKVCWLSRDECNDIKYHS